VFSSQIAQRLFAELAQSRSPHYDTPEPAAAAPTYSRPLSASSLKLFVECERRWLFRYLCNPIPEPGSPAATYGTAFHSALEHFHTIHTRIAPNDDAETLLTALRSDLERAFTQYAVELGTPLEAELARRRALRTAASYVAWLLQRAKKHPFTVVANEAVAPLTIDGQRFTGFIDRLDKLDEDGSIVVVDYKTGSIADSASIYREAVAGLREFQLPFYYWARTEQGDRVSRLMLLPLKDPARAVMPIELSVKPGLGDPDTDGSQGSIGIVELERAKGRMVELARLLSTAPPDHFRATTDPTLCETCPYTTACRERPSVAVDPFSR